MSDILRIIRPLSTDERLDCEAQAKTKIREHLDEPTRKIVDGETSSYPAYVVKWIWVGMGIVFIASALPSFFRLFTAGRDYFMYGAVQGQISIANASYLVPVARSGINDHFQATLVGFATFMLAEFLIILSAVASRVLFDKGDTIRRLFYVPMVIGFFIALEGNRIIERPHDFFGWLMTIAPPIAVLSIAVITEHIILDRVKSQYEADTHYKVKLREYRAWYDDPTTHKDFINIYVDLLQKAIYQRNIVGQGAKERRELMAGLTAYDWSRLVKQEMKRAGGWYQDGVDVAVNADDEPMTISISTHRAKLPMTAGGGVSNVSNLTQLDNEPRQMDDLDKVDNRQSVKRPSKAWDKAMKYLTNNPQDMELTTRELEEKIGVSRSTIANVLIELRNQND